MFCKLTEQQGGGYDLPIVRSVVDIRRVTEESNGRSYNMGALTEQQRADDFGWYDLNEITPSSDYDWGTPQYAIVGTTVTKGYPNATLKADDELRAKRLTDIDNKVKQLLEEPVLIGGVLTPVTPSLTDQLFYLSQQVGPAVYFRSEDGYVSLTVAERDQLVDDVTSRQRAILQNATVHYNAIALLTGQAILDYSIEIGWPV